MSDVVRLYLTVDNEGAIRAIRAVADESKVSADEIDHSNTKLSESNRKAGRSFDDVHESTDKLSGGISNLVGMVGLGGLAFGIKDIITAGTQWQNQQVALQGALKNTGAGGAAATKALTDAAEKSATQGGFGASEQLAGLTQFVGLTKNAGEAQKANTAAMELARRTGMGYSAAEKMVAMALTGSTGRLQKYLGIIQPVKTAMDALSKSHDVNITTLEVQAAAMGSSGKAWLYQQELIHRLNPLLVAHATLLDKQATAQKTLGLIQNYGAGAMAKYSKTAAGGLSNLTNSFENLQKALGTMLLPALTAIIPSLDSVAGFLGKHKTLTLVLIGALTALGVAWVAVTAATAAWEAVETLGGLAMGAGAIVTGIYEGALLALAIGFEAMGASAAVAWVLATGGLIILVAAVIGFVVLVITHFQQFKTIVAGIWQWLKGAAVDVFDFIKDHWKLLLSILTGPFGAAVIWIITHFSKIKDFFSGLWSDITTGVRALVDVFKKVFEDILKLPVIAQIIAVMKWVGNFLGLGGGKAGTKAQLHSPDSTAAGNGRFGPSVAQRAPLARPRTAPRAPSSSSSSNSSMPSNPMDTHPGSGHLADTGAADVIHHQPIVLKISGRQAAETVAIFSNRKAALS